VAPAVLFESCMQAALGQPHVHHHIIDHKRIDDGNSGNLGRRVLIESWNRRRGIRKLPCGSTAANTNERCELDSRDRVLAAYLASEGLVASDSQVIKAAVC
jgi:hypothetical protein